jgi:anti-sigma factor ChrR (cupin superfamily)
MILEGVVSSHVNTLEAVELFPGVRLKTLWKDASGAKAQCVEIDGGAKFLDLDVHEAGSEEVCVLEGVLNDGVCDYPAGSFIHNPKGSSHVPASATGCKLLVFLPQE